MNDQEFKYDVFLSHASEDAEWCLRLAKRLDQEGVRVWFDGWELQPGSYLEDRINDGLEHSRKMVAVWTKNYFADHKAWTQAESYARQHADILSRDRLLIPALREDCKPKPLQASLIPIDFRNDADFEIRIRTLIESLDLPRHDFIGRDEEFELVFREHDPRGLVAERSRGKIFEEEVARLYRLLGYEVEEVEISGVKIGLQVQKRQGGRMLRDIVACIHPFVASKEREQVLHHQFLAQKKFNNHGLIAVAQSFDAKVRAELEDSQINCATHADLLSELLPLGDYANGLIADYEREVDDRWNKEDWFVRPDIETDADNQTMPALKFFGKWLGDNRRNLVVLLGDLGTGKSTLSRFLAYNLARSYRDDPIRHPAPVLIPLTKLYKEAALNSIVTGHFSERGINNINFNAFQFLARERRLVIIFDAFDEMADRMVWRETLGNFLALVRAAEGEGKVRITCRTHYFKDRDDQAEVIGEAARTLEEITRKFKTEKPLLKAARENKAEVIYLKQFNDDQIRQYLGKARRATAGADWEKINETYNLEDLAQRPLLLTMIIESLDRFDEGEKIDAAKLYDRYTDDWISREFSKGRLNLKRQQKLAMMMEMARMMWDADKSAVHHREFRPFVERLVGEGRIELKEQEIEEITGEIHNASFLKRDEAGEFSFMHRSLMEFFLARLLCEKFVVPPSGGKGLKSEVVPPEGGTTNSGTTNSGTTNSGTTNSGTTNEIIKALDTRRFDQKMIFFFEKLDAGDAALEPLRQILTGGYQPRVSENALQLLYWTVRHRAGMEKEVTDPEVLRRALADRIPAGVKLAGAQFQDAALECVELSSADLAGADLTKAKLNHARLDHADLRKATLANVRFDNASAIGADFREANLEGASLNEATLNEADIRGAVLASVSIIGTSVIHAKGITRPPAPRKTLFPIVQRGHGGPVRSVAYSPDGELMASGGDDGLILIRRASDGKLLRALVGHTSSVYAVAFAHDGATLASGSYDNSVRLWEVKSGKCLMELTGNLGAVRAVAMAPNGKYLVAAGAAGRLQFWDLATGETFLYVYDFGEGAHLTLLPDGRFDASPEGLRYLSFTEEGTNKSYDAEELAKEFYRPDDVQAVLAKYV